ncbi:phosphomannomutase [Providencia sp. CRE-3FA-0001]|uniref:Phosphomannomutase n=1 Tax=Providencia huashanensis TaxID=3037798 RepID=A0AA42JUQ4_9GAMM|nr:MULTISPECIES: phosphomannomutase [Providencia]EIL1983013.1 phosphomannomutase [Providencia rettgeri]EIU9514902.1 phosphomannomutase [Providencia rettgeri]EJD6663200.1 phosphomannomutase [Providencia rettgeri]ELR5078214.1 phosphomannomutase [Providencia rettgeri]ELR5097054.1 phosphomannomutase [Providencia rettgeri]
MLSIFNIIKDSGIQFGTSGARGLVTQFTNESCSAFTHAFINSVKNKFDFKQIAIAIDNRPSSEFIATVCVTAIKQQGIEPLYYGVIPTPALAYTAMKNNIPCIMVTGSHIPFDRNGLKFYRPDGEITKVDEVAILNNNSQFEIPNVTLQHLSIGTLATEEYLTRYLSIFNENLLTGKRIGIYEHSSAGRDIYPILFKKLGAEVISLERSDQFVPIDTEAVSEGDKVKAKNWAKLYNLDAIFSTDGDGDRPLVADENGEWLRGDILGLLCALEMNIEALAVPVSCNTIIASHKSFKCVKQTKIGSPYVIEAFTDLTKDYKNIAGFEANGGFLLGSDIEINGKQLSALPTRDAVLPFLMLLSAAKKKGIAQLVNSLPQRVTYSDRIQNFATEKSKAIIEKAQENPTFLLQHLGFGDEQLLDLNTIDGLRMTLSNGNIIHLRPSGNAPELRCYAEANDHQTAQSIVQQSLKNIQTFSEN